jgi:glycosyltransferase involved in cell wall biosynthesis
MPTIFVMKTICMLLDGAYPNDIRVRKEAESLVENGFKVLVVCPRKKEDPERETINGVEVFRIGTNYSNFKKGIFDVIESVTNINLLFYSGLKQVFAQNSIDFLHVHDLPLAGTGFFFKSKVTQKLILDLHENYPEALKTWFLWKKSRFLKLKNSVFMNPTIWAKKERRFCEKYDVVICVVEEMKQKLITNFAINPEKLVVVSNHEKTNFIANFNHETAQNVIQKTDFSITYVGGFGPHRGLDTAIKAMPKIVQSIPNAILFLVGKGSIDVENTLKSIAEKYQISNAVRFVGHKPFVEVASIMQDSDINIIPHKANDHTNNTIPHKLFQIMMSGSLLLVSSCKPLKRVVEKYNAGVVFEADNEHDFSEKVIEIYTSQNQYQTQIQNAKKAVLEQDENWENESKKLEKIYQN